MPCVAWAYASILQGAVNDTIDALDQIFDARVEDAQRTREVLDTQISETQRPTPSILTMQAVRLPS